MNISESTRRMMWSSHINTGNKNIQRHVFDHIYQSQHKYTSHKSIKTWDFSQKHWNEDDWRWSWRVRLSVLSSQSSACSREGSAGPGPSTSSPAPSQTPWSRRCPARLQEVHSEKNKRIRGADHFNYLLTQRQED